MDIRFISTTVAAPIFILYVALQKCFLFIFYCMSDFFFFNNYLLRRCIESIFLRVAALERLACCHQRLRSLWQQFRPRAIAELRSCWPEIAFAGGPKSLPPSGRSWWRRTASRRRTWSRPECPAGRRRSDGPSNSSRARRPFPSSPFGRRSRQWGDRTRGSPSAWWGFGMGTGVLERGSFWLFAQFWRQGALLLTGSHLFGFVSQWIMYNGLSV